MRLDTLAVTGPLGALIFFGLWLLSAIFSARLSGVARFIYLWSLLLLNVPAIWFLLHYTLFAPSDGGGDVLGYGIAIFFVAGPFGIAWLLGWPTGLLFRSKLAAKE